jgi:hypothetical protein
MEKVAKVETKGAAKGLSPVQMAVHASQIVAGEALL